MFLITSTNMLHIMVVFGFGNYSLTVCLFSLEHNNVNYVHEIYKIVDENDRLISGTLYDTLKIVLNKWLFLKNESSIPNDSNSNITLK